MASDSAKILHFICLLIICLSTAINQGSVFSHSCKHTDTYIYKIIGGNDYTNEVMYLDVCHAIAQSLVPHKHHGAFSVPTWLVLSCCHQTYLSPRLKTALLVLFSKYVTFLEVGLGKMNLKEAKR